MTHQVVHIIKSAGAECSAQARIVAALAGGIDRNRYNLQCCFIHGDGPLSAELQRAGVQTYVLGWNGRRAHWPAALRFVKYLRRERFAIAHQHGGAATARVLARAAGVKANVLHLHSRVRDESALQPARISPRAADAVIATSEAVAKCVVGVQAQVIYPGVNDTPGPQPSAGTGIIGTAARLIPLKGIEYLIRAVALVRKDLPQVQLQIAGVGPAQVQLQGEVQQLGLGACVQFLGWQSNLASCFDRWNVFALPSLEEAFGMAALEAMAAGVPVVATNVGGIPELVVDGRTGWLVSPRDPPGMASRLLQLLRDPQQHRSMSLAAQARAVSHFSCERMVNAVAAIYDLLIQDKHSLLQS